MANNSLYPDILFHFTSSKTNLFSILDDTFRLSYASETLLGPATSKSFALPMVSFCDLRVTELKYHMTKYGNYGIGLTKDWANKMGLSPVLYLSRHAEIVDTLSRGIDDLYDILINHTEPAQEIKMRNAYNASFSTLHFVKNYQADLTRKNKLYRDFRFADEREWRYIPNLFVDRDLCVLNPSQIDTSAKKQFANTRINMHTLHFQPDDIKYLIIKDDREINELIRVIRNIKGPRFSSDIVDRLMTRILTSEQIHYDI